MPLFFTYFPFNIVMSKKKILVVEDEVIIALDLKMLLVEQGYKVLPIALSGEEAISLAKQYKPHVILMDIILKGDLDGIEAANQIHVDNDEIPVVFITGNIHIFADRKLLPKGKFEVLPKPPLEPELLATINKLLAK